MKFTLLNVVLAAVFAYVVYQYVIREHMSTSTGVTTMIVFIVLGLLFLAILVGAFSSIVSS